MEKKHHFIGNDHHVRKKLRLLPSRTRRKIQALLLLSLLDIPDSAKNAIPSDIPEGIDHNLAMDIWVTLLVLVGLKKKFADKVIEWCAIAKKSEKWAKQ